MGNNSEYMTLEESAGALSKPVSWVKESICRGELGGMLTRSGWLVSASDLDKLRFSLSPEPEKVVHNLLPNHSPQEQNKPRIQIKKETNLRGGMAGSRPTNKDKELETLDAQVRKLTCQVEVQLLYLKGGQFIWNKLKADKYQLNKDRREHLPKALIIVLDELCATKQKYILLRETNRYKQLLSSLPDWDSRRVSKAIKVVQKEQLKKKPAVTSKTTQVRGIAGYYAGRSLVEKRCWWNEED